jgi:hypothetical protein
MRALFIFELVCIDGVPFSCCSLLNPMFLFAMMCLGGFWFYSSGTAAEDGTVVLFGRPVTPEQRRLGMIASKFTDSERRFDSVTHRAVCAHSFIDRHRCLRRLDPVLDLHCQVRCLSYLPSPFEHSNHLSDHAVPRSQPPTPCFATALPFATRMSWVSCPMRVPRLPTLCKRTAII